MARAFSEKYMKYIVLAAAAAMCAAGVLRGEAAQVMSKAVRICMECCGIG